MQHPNSSHNRHGSEILSPRPPPVTISEKLAVINACRKNKEIRNLILHARQSAARVESDDFLELEGQQGPLSVVNMDSLDQCFRSLQQCFGSSTPEQGFADFLAFIDRMEMGMRNS
ncbi:hypothetical protein EXS70_03650 [Candidatus Peribacteria bacterium]|nr:hypothetical protein [Candidatus Peribacteria bacterium]